MIDKNNIWSMEASPIEEPKVVEIHVDENVYQFTIKEMGLTKEGDLVIHFEQGGEIVIEKGLIK